jgi:hypothetical protein
VATETEESVLAKVVQIDNPGKKVDLTVDWNLGCPPAASC